MKTIYIDSEFKCHITNDGTMTAVETDAFDGKCDAHIEGYCYDASNGYPKVYPWKDSKELEAAQEQYEKDQAQMQDMENALAILLGGETV